MAAAVAIQSVLDTAHHRASLRFWLLTPGLAVSKTAPIERLVQAAGARLTVVDCAAEHARMRAVRVDRHLSTASYYRLFLPDLLPAGVERVVYLDCDVLVRADIEDLFVTDLGDTSIGAVLNPLSPSYRTIGLERSEDYFNSGVLLLDLVRLRDTCEHRRAAEFAQNHPEKVPTHDQDALNHVLAGVWRRLDVRWNQQVKFFRYHAGRLGLSPAELRRLRTAPFIVHFSSRSKPWHYENGHPFRGRWYETLDRTPFAGWRPQPKNLAARARRVLAMIFPASLEPAHLRNRLRPHYHDFKARLRRLFAMGRTS